MLINTWIKCKKKFVGEIKEILGKSKEFYDLKESLEEFCKQL